MPEYMCKIGPDGCPSQVHAYDEVEAAEKFAEEQCVSVDEWPSDMEVVVDDVAYIVTVESLPTFSAIMK